MSQFLVSLGQSLARLVERFVRLATTPTEPTEEDWLTAADPTELLNALYGVNRFGQPWPNPLAGAASPRKLRLFGAACCRRFLPGCHDDQIPPLVEAAERRADGALGEGLWAAARAAAPRLAQAACGDLIDLENRTAPVLEHFSYNVQARASASQAALHLINLLNPEADDHRNRHFAICSAAVEAAVWQALRASPSTSRPPPDDPEQEPPLLAIPRTLRPRERQAQADLLRDIVGNPFHPAPTLDPAWLEWNGGTVQRLARAVYDERRFDDLPILADALEEAGCDCAELIAHCRAGGEHARGCWALDLLLGQS
jgi:hypothetical protein